MTFGVLDIFRIGIGPSSSHTVGPMRDPRRFAQHLHGSIWEDVDRIRVELHGSLSGYRHGPSHGSCDCAVLKNVSGWLAVAKGSFVYAACTRPGETCAHW
jgi:L-serine dehydratase